MPNTSCFWTQTDEYSIDRLTSSVIPIIPTDRSTLNCISVSDTGSEFLKTLEFSNIQTATLDVAGFNLKPAVLSNTVNLHNIEANEGINFDLLIKRYCL